MVANEDDNLNGGMSGGPPNPMERRWIHPSELPSVTPARKHRLRGAGAVMGTCVVVFGAAAVGVTAFRHQGSSVTTVVACCSATVPMISDQVATITDANGHGALGAVLDHGTMVVTSLHDSKGAHASVTTGSGAQRGARLVALDSQLGVSMWKLSASVSSTPQQSLTLQAMTHSQVDVVRGSSLRSAHSSPSTISEVTATVGTQDLGVLETTVATSSPGLLTTMAGEPEAMLVPNLGNNLALPLDVLEQREQLLMSGHSHGWLQIDAATASSGGVSISQVGSASALALEVGDIITSINGHAISTTGDLLDILYATPAGATVRVTFSRQGKTLTEAIVLASHP
jgi:PDZ domain